MNLKPYPWEALPDHFLDTSKLCGLQRRVETLDLKLVQLPIVQRTILRGNRQHCKQMLLLARVRLLRDWWVLTMIGMWRMQC